MSYRRKVELGANALAILLEEPTLNWVPLSIMIRLGIPNLQIIDLRKATAAPWVILTTGVASSHFVNLSIVTKRKWYPLTALGNGPRISTPHTANGQEGGIICRA
jgi:hypothetical protein